MDSSLQQWGEWPPLVTGLLEHARADHLDFHMPGHKQGRGALPQWRDLLGEAIFSLDLTELPGLDNLQDPHGIIGQAAAAAASYFGADETYLSVNGTTAALLAVLLATCRPGDQVLLPRNCHQALINGLILNGASPYYLPVHSDQVWGLPGMLRTSDLEAALAQRNVHGHILVLLNPNYYGLAGNLQEQVALAHRLGRTVLVDEAHGAHFQSSSSYPTPALCCGADYVAQGAHKVLGAFTQAAYLHRLGHQEQSDKLREAFCLIQTSSPSYLLLASLDIARRQCQQEAPGWAAIAQSSLVLRQRINRIEGLRAPGQELLEVPGVVAFDPARLIVNVAELGINGFEAASWLQDQRGVLVEMADFQNLVFILGPSDIGLLGQLYDALEALSTSCSGAGSRRRSYPDPLDLPLPKQKLSPRVAFFSNQETVKLEASRGRIAAQIVAPYPPGVPVLCPGEEISGEAVDLLKEWTSAGGTWPGGNCGTIKVVAGG